MPTSPTREEILDAFAVENAPGRETLERYIRLYPSHASALIDLSRELARSADDGVFELSASDETRIDLAWQRHLEAAPSMVADPLAALSIDELRQVAKELDLPRQVVTAFRERKVAVSSVPRRFLAQFAAALHSTVDALMDSLSLPPTSALARSYKADDKPGGVGQVTFESILTDAGVSQERRASLLADGD